MGIHQSTASLTLKNVVGAIIEKSNVLIKLSTAIEEMENERERENAIALSIPCTNN